MQVSIEKNDGLLVKQSKGGVDFLPFSHTKRGVASEEDMVSLHVTDSEEGVASQQVSHKTRRCGLSTCQV